MDEYEVVSITPKEQEFEVVSTSPVSKTDIAKEYASNTADTLSDAYTGAKHGFAKIYGGVQSALPDSLQFPPADIRDVLMQYSKRKFDEASKRSPISSTVGAAIPGAAATSVGGPGFIPSVVGGSLLNAFEYDYDEKPPDNEKELFEYYAKKMGKGAAASAAGYGIGKGIGAAFQIPAKLFSGNADDIGATVGKENITTMYGDAIDFLKSKGYKLTPGEKFRGKTFDAIESAAKDSVHHHNNRLTNKLILDKFGVKEDSLSPKALEKISDSLKRKMDLPEKYIFTNDRKFAFDEIRLAEELSEIRASNAPEFVDFKKLSNKLHHGLNSTKGLPGKLYNEVRDSISKMIRSKATSSLQKEALLKYRNSIDDLVSRQMPDNEMAQVLKARSDYADYKVIKDSVVGEDVSLPKLATKLAKRGEKEYAKPTLLNQMAQAGDLLSREKGKSSIGKVLLPTSTDAGFIERVAAGTSGLWAKPYFALGPSGYRVINEMNPYTPDLFPLLSGAYGGNLLRMTQ